MPAPALRIPVALDMQSFQRQTSQVGDHIGSFLRQVAQRVDQANSSMVATTVLSATRMVAAFTVAAVGVKLLQDAINATRADLEKMVGIADKATNAGVSPVFFQQFTSEASKLKVSVEDLEAALQNSLGATKAPAPIDLSEWDFAKEKIDNVEKLLRVLNATGEKVEGLVLYRDAQNQEQKIEAVLLTMKQLEEQGRKLEAMQLGEAMFGAQFVNNIRLGKTSVESMLASMKAATEAGSGLFSDEMVKRAKEVDDQLKLAHQRLDKELRPQWNALARTMLDIKSLWADVVNLIASAARFLNQIDLATKRDELSRVNRAIETGDSLIPGVPRVPETVRSVLGAKTTIQDDLVARRARLEEEIAELEGRLRTRVTVTGETRGTGAVPSKFQETSRFDSAINTAEKRAAAMKAEAEAIDLTAAARERAKLVAELETIAVQVNTAAGKENTEVTAEQREEIDRVAAAYEAAAAKLEVLRGPLASFLRESRNLEKGLQEVVVSGLRGLEDALISIANRTKTTAEAFREMASAIVADIGRILIRAAIAKAAGVLLPSFGLGGGTATAGFTGSAVGAGGVNTLPFGGPRAGGGPVSAGVAYEIGERGRELFIPRAAGQIVPNDVVRGMGGATSITYAPSYDARGADIAAVARLERAMARDRMEFASRVKALVQARPSQRW